jgi:hypothetical protein
MKVDYVVFIWKDIISIIKKKVDMSPIPYPRVLSTLIMDTLDKLKESVDGNTFEVQKWKCKPRWSTKDGETPIGTLNPSMLSYIPPDSTYLLKDMTPADQ